MLEAIDDVRILQLILETRHNFLNSGDFACYIGRIQCRFINLEIHEPAKREHRRFSGKTP